MGGRGQPLEAELGPMHHHLAQPTNLRMNPEALHHPSIPADATVTGPRRRAMPDQRHLLPRGRPVSLATGRLSPVRAASSISRVAAIQIRAVGRDLAACLHQHHVTRHQLGGVDLQRLAVAADPGHRLIIQARASTAASRMICMKSRYWQERLRRPSWDIYQG